MSIADHRVKWFLLRSSSWQLFQASFALKNFDIAYAEMKKGLYL